MSLKTILNKQTDFTGEFPAEYAASGLWRFNEAAPDEDMERPLTPTKLDGRDESNSPSKSPGKEEPECLKLQ